MSADVGLEFVLLSNGVRPSGSELATRSVGSGSFDLRVGIDKDGFRHVIAPLAQPLVGGRGSAALSLGERTLLVDGNAVLFADLKCSDKRLSLVFERLVSDVVERIDGGAAPGTALSMALDEWRDLFRAAPRTFTLDHAVGLIGELVVLERLSDSLGAKAAIDAWWGPDGHVHDFYSTSARAIEVKTTRSLDGNRIHVSNLAQLDPRDLTDLHLVALRLKPDQKAPDLDERISGLLEKGLPAADLLAKIHAAGYIHESRVEFSTRFSVVGQRWWLVGDDFPGLRESRLAPSALVGVGNVKYELSLDAVEAPLADDRVEALIADWSTRA